jgi:hypothetical protein
MANKALDILYNWAKSTGYEKSPDDFYNLISTNKDAFNRVYNYAKETGYERDENAFAGLVGIQTAPPVEPIRRSEEGAAPTPVAMDGGGAEEQPMPAAPESTSVAVKDVTPKAQSVMVVRKPVDPVDPDKEGASPTPPIMESRGGAGAETPEATPSALESDINRQLLPVTENTVIKEVPAESDKMVIQSPEKKKDFLEAADEVLYRIYNSPGYLKKLENEIAQSKDFNKDYDPKVLEELNAKAKDIGRKMDLLKPEEKKEYNALVDELSIIQKQQGKIYTKLSLIGGKYSTTELANERRKRVETTKVGNSEDTYALADSAGFTRISYENPEPTPDFSQTSTPESAGEYEDRINEFNAKEQPLKTNIYLNPEVIKTDMYKSNEYSPEDYGSDLMATAIEEKEHSSHIPFINPGGLGGNKAENITPYAVEVIKENVIIDDGYLNVPTEVIAKKRATEVNLIGRGLLNPGENVDESHFKELLKSPNIPFNITQLLQAVSGIEEDEENAIKATKKIQDKILNDPKLYKESLERWLNIMNKIAFNENKDSKTFDINPFGIDKTKTG